VRRQVSIPPRDKLEAISSSVTVVIPTRNRLRLLKEALDSVWGQLYTDWELIVVDDASDDGTAEWLSANAQARTRAIRLESHLERSAARNRGLWAARGEFVLFLDDDDRLRLDALGALTRTLRANPKAVAAVGSHVVVDEHRSRPPGWRPLPVSFVRDIWPETLFGWVPLPGQCLFRTNHLRACGGWNEAKTLIAKEDQDLWLRLGPAAFVPTTVLEYRVHPGQWRGADHELEEMQLREDFLHVVRPDQVSVANGAIRARTLMRAAFNAHSQGDFWPALRSALAAVSSAPRLLSSPITAPMMLSQVVRAALGVVLGRRGMRTLRWVKASAAQAWCQAVRERGHFQPSNGFGRQRGRPSL
jgi:hypothetical protein